MIQPPEVAPDIDVDIAGNLARVCAEITASAAARPATAREPNTEAPHECRLIAVSKTQPADKVDAALRSGHRIFGENRVQEAAEKWPALREAYAAHDGVELHLIGSLQTNKVKQALGLFDVIQTLDRPKLAKVLAREIASDAKTKLPPRLFIQVNTGEEPQKGGVLPADLEALLALSRDELGLDVVGLMCIPPQDDDPAFHFALLSKLARRFGLSELSMGMSSDYELAARMGASYVRVGTAIFGARQLPSDAPA